MCDLLKISAHVTLQLLRHVHISTEEHPAFLLVGHVGQALMQHAD